MFVFVVAVTVSLYVNVCYVNTQNRLYNKHYPSILVTFLGRPSIFVEHFSWETKA